MKISVKAYRACEHLDIAEEFLEGHIQVLKDFGIENVTSNTREWMSDPNVYMIVARQDDNEKMVGGVRVQIYDGKHFMPIQYALVDLDPKINQVIDSLAPNGICEGCGLWNSKRVFGRGVSHILTRCAVALAGLLPVRTLLGLSAPYTKQMAMEKGYCVLDEIGDGGYFDYPIPSHRACALIIRDLEKLPGHTLDSERHAIHEIRKANGVVRHENFNGKEITVEYNLIPSHSVQA
ncbi:MAG: hypothetical protein JNM00_09090 [Flavobacteriales bacterium]|nr:hypothetical protein [Flavobacteriales bacterium]